MKKITMFPQALIAAMLGVLCSVCYLAVYIGWQGLVVCWFVFMLLGALLMIPRKQKTSDSL